MPQTQGHVLSIFIRQVALPSTVLDASITLRVRTGVIERLYTFTLWENPVSDCIPSSVSIARSLNVSMLRQALLNKLEVILSHSDWVIVTDDQGRVTEKSFVEAVTLLAGP
jgi:hypothetical protein